MIARLIQALVPLYCLDCRREGDAICLSCRPKYRLSSQVCFGCGLASADGVACVKCSPHHMLTAVSVAASYRGAIKELILALKFHRLRSAVDTAAEFMLPIIPAGQFDEITSVPIAPARYRERGYNQSELLAKVIARKMGVPYRRMLGRQDAHHQLGMDRAGRLRQVKGAFYSIGQVAGGRFLVVDDVVTTAATLDECARVLYLAGATEVQGVALARR